MVADPETQVVDANRRFYDVIAPVYDSIDSRRRAQPKTPWLNKVLEDLKNHAPTKTGARFLDAGAGSGFLSTRASLTFEDVTLLDVSSKMLDRIEIPELTSNAKTQVKVTKVVGDCNQMPFEGDTFDCVGAFATLHHLYSPKKFFKEAYRVLKPGGLLYTDHDIESHFVNRFSWPLSVYRRLFDHGHGYLESCPQAEESDYHLSEFHGDRGLNIHELVSDLERVGFHIKTQLCHWEGMGPLGKIATWGPFARLGVGIGRAPVIRLIAVKYPRG